MIGDVYSIVDEPRNAHASVGEFVYSEIRRQIVSWTLKPGQRISEAEMSVALKVSRTPVREGFIKLKNEGLVEILPQRGTVISKIDVKKVEESLFIRKCIEREIVKIICKDFKQEYIDMCKKYLQEQYEALKEKDNIKFFRSDILFHRVFFLACDKEVTWEFIQQTSAQYERVRTLTLVDVDSYKRLYETHTLLLEKIIEGDFERANHLNEEHMNTLYPELEISRKEHPEYFLDNKSPQ